MHFKALKVYDPLVIEHPGLNITMNHCGDLNKTTIFDKISMRLFQQIRFHRPPICEARSFIRNVPFESSRPRNASTLENPGLKAGDSRLLRMTFDVHEQHQTPFDSIQSTRSFLVKKKQIGRTSKEENATFQISRIGLKSCLIVGQVRNLST